MALMNVSSNYVPVNVGKTSSELYNSDDLISKGLKMELLDDVKCEVDDGVTNAFFPELSDDEDTGKESEDGDSKDETFESEVGSDVGSEKSKAKHNRPVDLQYSRIPGNNDQWKCRLCDFETEKYSRMRYHARTAHGGEKKIYKCDICLKELSTPTSYHLHMKMHRIGPERQFKCGKCFEAFKMKHHLQRHEAVVHGGPKAKSMETYDCQPCQKKFASKEGYRQHMKTVRHGGAQYECAVCQKKFNTKQGYYRHIKTQHVDKSGQDTVTAPVQCRQCDKTYKNEAALKVHVAKIHSAVGETEKNVRHRCELCGKGFVCNSELRYHMMRHMQEYPFSCDKCRGGYPTESELRKHQKKSKCGKEKVEKMDGVLELPS